MARLSSFTTSSTSVMPFSAASATTYSRAGVVTIGASSFGSVLVNGRKRVPRPAAGISALHTVRLDMDPRLTGHNRCCVRHRTDGRQAGPARRVPAVAPSTDAPADRGGAFGRPDGGRAAVHRHRME